VISTTDAFEIVRAALLAASIRYAVGGSWASTAFGEPRFTNDVDILVDVTPQNLSVFLNNLPDSFYKDAEEALSSIRRGRPFNVIHMPTVLKFDLFPASAFPLGREELDRAVSIENTGPGVVRGCAARLDRAYLEDAAPKLGVRDLLQRALNEH
jgi:hypothetical protein